jgi:hypothetical protein
MATTLMVSIKVEDFAKWKTAYDAAEQMRTNMGIKIKGIYQSVDDENSVTLISEYPSIEVARKILADPQWEENQKRAGVIGGFETKFFNSVN